MIQGGSENFLAQPKGLKNIWFLIRFLEKSLANHFSAPDIIIY